LIDENRNHQSHQCHSVSGSTLINGFQDWFKANEAAIRECFTPLCEELFETLEDFAVELYFEWKEETA
jgi:hypothetical protein